ncbi:MAG: class I SAM-dependent methyltransferase [Myxococcales bacterium]|nr:class I SAM-dependent methyltransferase [Myxococcales bacterium]
MSGHYEVVDWYQLPRYYDIAFASRNRREVDFLQALYERYALQGGAILEPACGSGRLMEGLLRRGHEVHGFDLGEAMVEYARKRLDARNMGGTLWVGDMSAFRGRKRYAMAHCLVSSFKYLLTEKAALSHLQCVADSLRKGGVYVLGFHLSDYDDQRDDSEEHGGRRGQAAVECRIDSGPPNRKTRLESIRARLRVNLPTRTLASETTWQFRTYDEKQFLKLLAKVPSLAHVATHNFSYRADEEIEFGEEDLDSVVILRKH